MEEKRLELDREEQEHACGSGSLRRRVYRHRKSRCDGRIWIFLILGFMMIVFGVVIGGMYLNIRALTESLQYTEVLPTYVTALAVLGSGLFIFLLFWKRLPCLVFVCVLVCVTTALLCAVAAILTGTHVIQPIEAFIHCTYYDSLKECHCVSPYRRALLDLQHSALNPANYVFHSTSNCNSIQTTLLHMLYALTVTYATAFVTSVVSVILALLVLRTERIRRGVFEDDTYEEIFTVSNSSTPLTSDSDNDNNFCLPPFNDANLTDVARVPETRTNAGVIRRCRSFTQPRFFDSTEESTEDAHLPKTQARAEEKRNTESELKTGGKLKENRRRHRRAVTLHNLDTRQLMMILSLHMRYLQENEAAKSQGNIDTERQEEMEAKQRMRRALTPQPSQYRRYFSQDDSASQARIVRSHTPQPCHERRSQSQDETSSSSYVVRSHTPQPQRRGQSQDDETASSSYVVRSHTPQPHHERRGQSQDDGTSSSSYVVRSHTPQPHHERRSQSQDNTASSSYVVRSHTPQPYQTRSNTTGGQLNYENTFDPAEFVQLMREQKSARGVRPQQREATPPKELVGGVQGQIYENVLDATDVSSQCGSESSDCPVQQVAARAKQKTKKPSAPTVGTESSASGKSVRAKRSPVRETSPNNYDEIDDLSSCTSETPNHQIYQNQEECEHLNQPMKSSLPPVMSSVSSNRPMKSSVSLHRPVESPGSSNQPTNSSVSSHQPMKSSVSSRQPIKSSVSSHRPIIKVDPPRVPPHPSFNENDSSCSFYQQIGQGDSKSTPSHQRPTADLNYNTPHLPIPETDPLPQCSNSPTIELDPYAPYPSSRSRKENATKGKPIQITNSSSGRGFETSLSQRLKDASDHLHPIQTDIRGHLLDRCQTPSRPKSYINAVDQSLSQPVEDNLMDLGKCPEIDGSSLPTGAHTDSEGYLRMDMNSRSPAVPGDIYAQPVKKPRKNKKAKNRERLPPREGISESDMEMIAKLEKRKQNKPPFSGEGSAFRAVCRHHTFEPIDDPYSVDQPIISRHSSQQSMRQREENNIVCSYSIDQPMESSHSSRHRKRLAGPQEQHVNQTDYDCVYPVFEKSQHTAYAPPPYSPPPSYTEVFTGSRDGSQHSLPTTMSSNSDSDFYQHDTAKSGPRLVLQEQFYENNPHIQRGGAVLSCPPNQGHSLPVRPNCTGKADPRASPGFPVRLDAEENVLGSPRRNWVRYDSGDAQFDEYQRVVVDIPKTTDDSDADAMETVI